MGFDELSSDSFECCHVFQALSDQALSDLKGTGSGCVPCAGSWRAWRATALSVQNTKSLEKGGSVRVDKSCQDSTTDSVAGTGARLVAGDECREVRVAASNLSYEKKKN